MLGPTTRWWWFVAPGTGDHIPAHAIDHPAVVAMASSAGGLAALSAVLSAFPADFPAAILVVQHLDPVHTSHLAEIMERRIAIHATQAHDGERVRHGTAYFAIPDRHLLLNNDGTLSLTSAPAVHFVRPAADLLFSSVAASSGDQAIAVVLSGGGSDGAEGVVAVAKAGGTVIAQDEQSSEFFSMPRAAIETGRVDHVLPLDSIADCIMKLVDDRSKVT